MLAAIQAWDAGALLWIQEVVRAPVLDGWITGFTHLGDSGFLWIFVAIVLLFIPKTRKLGVLTLAALALGAACNNLLLKNLVGRPRPYDTVAALVPLLTERSLSFPSGHSCAAFAAGWVWFRGLENRKLGVLSLVLAVLMALSRLYVGVHYPSDVLGGAIVGLICGEIVWHLGRRLTFVWKQKRKTPQD